MARHTSSAPPRQSADDGTSDRKNGRIVPILPVVRARALASLAFEGAPYGRTIGSPPTHP